jgi:hypothetical protein
VEEWSVSCAGLYLYYPGHKQVPSALRRRIDMIRAGAKPGVPRQSDASALPISGRAAEELWSAIPGVGDSPIVRISHAILILRIDRTSFT